MGSLHEPGLQQTPGCSEAADILGSCQRVPPTLPASPRRLCHVPSGCQTLPVPRTPFISGWREEGLAKITLQPGQGLGTALGGLGMGPGVSLWYPA